MQAFGVVVSRPVAEFAVRTQVGAVLATHGEFGTDALVVQQQLGVGEVVVHL
jgi:hypothetical protein